MRPDRTTPCSELLAALADPAIDRIGASHVAVVVAHPDDETIGCGAQLRRLDGASVIIVTDGAPRDLRDARRIGFAAATDYAATRERELKTAMAVAGVRSDRVTHLRVPDQEVALRLPQLSLALGCLLAQRRIRIVITHAFEGGHPDHDATAFCVHAAAALGRADGRATGVIEAPFYRLGAHGIVRQEFAGPPHAGERVLHLTAKERALKRLMIAAHRTQCGVLAPFRVDIERFRPSPAYDFARRPNGGRVLYEGYPWGLDGTRWCRLARAARGQLRLGDAPC
jgi:LmbE family N-acetylglucosaminyl deacetylase